MVFSRALACSKKNNPWAGPHFFERRAKAKQSWGMTGRQGGLQRRNCQPGTWGFHPQTVGDREGEVICGRSLEAEQKVKSRSRTISLGGATELTMDIIYLRRDDRPEQRAYNNRWVWEKKHLQKPCRIENDGDQDYVEKI